MRELYIWLFGSQFLGALLSFLIFHQGELYSIWMAALLLFICASAAKLLLLRTGKSPRLVRLITLLCLAGCLLLGLSYTFPLFAVLSLEFSDSLAGRRYFWQIAVTITVLAGLIDPPQWEGTLAAAALFIPCAFARLLIYRLEETREALDQQKSDTDTLSARLSDHRRMARALQYTARLQERNRIAARIHDKIGHGISGSIILLEAALLTMEKNPQAARSTLLQTVENLRGSVDDIRMSLREERVELQDIGPADIRSRLDKCEVDFELETRFIQSGRPDVVPPQVYRCVYENLEEALTNTLKHSDATRITVSIETAGKLIRAQIKDNGRPDPQIKEGMGLINIKDRVLLCGGHCYINSLPDGFSIRAVFPVTPEGGKL